MEINNTIFNKIKSNTENQIRSLIKGEIVKVEGSMVLIDIEGKGIISAKTDIDLSLFLGKSMEFILEKTAGELIVIRPRMDEAGLVDRENLAGDELSHKTIDTLLDSFNIAKTDESRSMVKSLMEHKLPLSEENINKAFKLMDKISILMKGEEGLELVKNPKEETIHPGGKADTSLRAEIDRLKLEIQRQEGSLPLDGKEPLEEPLNGNNRELDKKYELLNKLIGEKFGLEEEVTFDIRNIIRSSQGDDKLARLVGENLHDLGELGQLASKEKIVSLLIRYKIRPSLNNIKNLKMFLDDPLTFFKDFKELSPKVSDKKFMEILEDLDKMDKDGLVINSSQEEQGEELAPELRETQKKLRELASKIEFLKDLNKEIYYNVIPFTYGEKRLEGLINIIKEKRSKKLGPDSPISIFINLDTEFLGQVQVFLKSLSQELYIKIGVEDSSIDIFRSQKEALIKKVEALDYRLKNLEIVSKEELNIGEDLLEEENKEIKFLDIRV